MHEAILPQCQEKFSLYDKHLEDAPANRDMIVKHETKIKVLCSDIRDLKKYIFGSAIATILTIVLAALGLAVTWGKTLEKVERLDRMHQEAIK